MRSECVDFSNENICVQWQGLFLWLHRLVIDMSGSLSSDIPSNGNVRYKSLLGWDSVTACVCCVCDFVKKDQRIRAYHP